MKTINLSEAATLNIECPRGRTFDMAINLNRNLTGKSFKMHVSIGTPLVFESGNGLAIEGQTIRLTKTPTQMLIPTGCYQYDLVELSPDGKAEDIFIGWFIVKPTTTTL